MVKRSKSYKKFDYKKEFPDIYTASPTEPKIVDIPNMKFFIIDGKGDPNTSEEFKEAIKTLYSASFTLKMKFIKKETPKKDYVVPPLEALWFVEGNKPWSMEEKENWCFRLMIRIPDFAKDIQIQKAIQSLEEKKDLPMLSKLKVEEFHEGLCAQILHIGPYNKEIETIEKLYKFIKDKGYKLRDKHHEIYLSDPRRCKPQNLKTILRQPIKK